MVSSVSSPGKAVVTPAAEARIIYVSISAGDDTNDGLSPDFPVKTITRGEQLVRDRSPDWLLLKRGDRWQVGLDDWHKRGRGPEQPMIIGAYGTGPRPLMKSGTANAPELSMEFVTVIGVQFVADARLRAAAVSASRWNNRVGIDPGAVRRAGSAAGSPRPGHNTDEPIVNKPSVTPRSQPGQSATRATPSHADSDSIEWPIEIPELAPVVEAAAPAGNVEPRPSRVFYDITSIASAIPSPAEALRPIRLDPSESIDIPSVRLVPKLTANTIEAIAPLMPLSERIAKQAQCAPLRVKHISLSDDDKSVIVSFSGTIAAGVDRSDLLLISSDGTTIDTTALAVRCDDSGQQAIWTFAGLPGQVLPAGYWQVTLRGCITDDRGQQLDGACDGIGGDEYRSPVRLVSQGRPPVVLTRTCIEPFLSRVAA